MHFGVFDLFRIGVGPSSSHTVGPMEAGRIFLERLEEAGRLGDITRLQVEAYGSLALTGSGHATDKAMLWGLEGVAPEEADPDVLPGPEVLDDQGDLPDTARQERPACYNLLGIHAALANQSWREVLDQFAGQGFAQFKQALTELAVARLGPMGEEMQRLMADPAEIDRILADGAERADRISRPVLEEAMAAMGFLRPGA